MEGTKKLKNNLQTKGKTRRRNRHQTALLKFALQGGKDIYLNSVKTLDQKGQKNFAFGPMDYSEIIQGAHISRTS
jgi:catalase